MPSPPSRVLPSGMVTFVFTDIEGSTRILKRRPDDAELLFERHREVIRASIARSRGCEVGTEGDAFFIAFENVDDALAMCADAQRSLQAEGWPDDGVIRVRMGVHSGMAAPRNDDYVALAVHQAARVVGTAHGGQIVVTDTALKRAALSVPGVITPLGRYRVRDFEGPTVLHRLDLPDLPIVDRAISATPDSGHNLVATNTRFVGRESEIAQISSLIGPQRVVTLVGAGGIGKTRLTTEIGRQLAVEWEDGVWRVELAELTDSSLVPGEIASTLGIRPTPGTDGWDDVVNWARERVALLIIDNVENHLESCATLLTEITSTAGVAVLATSREAMKIAGEVVFRVPPLEVPGRAAAGEAIWSVPAVELFVDRARATRPDLVFDERNAATVAELCTRLDGLPLAIEIAASRLGVLTMEDVLDGLTNRFGLLRTADRTLPERQRRLLDVMTWSYDLLSHQERLAFRHLAVFGGTFTIDTAVAALADSGLVVDEVPELVWALVDKSLVVADLSASGTRYRMLDSVHDFADRELVESGDADAATRRWAGELLNRVGPWLNTDRRWLSDVEVELPNIRAVIRRVGVDDEEAAQALCCTLSLYHHAVQSYTAGIGELTPAASRLVERTSTRVVLLASIAYLHLQQADTTTAGQLLDTARDLQQEVGPAEWNDAALERASGELMSRVGDYTSAVDIARRALEQELSPLGRARMWNLDGIASYLNGDVERAVVAFHREIELFEELGFDAQAASAHGNLSEAAMELGDEQVAARHQLSCLDLAVSIGQPVLVAFSCLIAARISAGHEQWGLALRLQAHAEAELSLAGHALYEAERKPLLELEARAVDLLGAAAAEEEAAAGLALGSEDAIELARQVLSDVGSGDYRPDSREQALGRSE